MVETDFIQDLGEKRSQYRTGLNFEYSTGKRGFIAKVWGEGGQWLENY